MVSFEKLVKFGRLGNQLFMYAFLRTTAQRLGVGFYCPKWIGDEIFDLKDSKEREQALSSSRKYFEEKYRPGFDPQALEIEDNTDIEGFFQSERYFSHADVKEWFAFKEEKFSAVKGKYEDIDFADATAIHLRLGDYLTSPPIYYIPKLAYFREALEKCPHKKTVLVFSDDPGTARSYLAGLPGNIVFIEGNKDYEDFYLMSRCRSIICSASSFSWWAAYLNGFADKTIVVPEKWFAPSAPFRNDDIYPEGWIRIRAHRFFLDDFRFRIFPYYAKKILKRFNERVVVVMKEEGFSILARNIARKIEKKISAKTPIISKIRASWNSFLKKNIYNNLPEPKKWIIDQGSLRVSSLDDYSRLRKFYACRSEKFEDYLADPANPKKEYIDLKFAAYLQCYDQRKATFETLKSFRNYFKDVPVRLLSDKGQDFSDIARHFSCDYEYSQENLAYWPCKDMVAWFRRLYDTCLMYPDADWILILEDDVRVRDRISKYPNAHIAGHGGEYEGIFSRKAKKYIWNLHPRLEIRGYSGAGGTIFYRESFIECFKSIHLYDVEKLRKIDERLAWATDISLTFLFHLNGFINRKWFDLSTESQGYFGPASAFDHQYKDNYGKSLTREDLASL